MRMTRPALHFLLTLLFPAGAAAQTAPVADHHQHLFSPTLVALLDTTGKAQPITAREPRESWAAFRRLR
jgi:hypothetical protein